MSRKSIFITGAASGIGRATAILFAKNGWYVGLFDIDDKALAELSKNIGEDNCCFLKTDVANPAEVKSAVAFFSAHTGGTMHALFNCAGILKIGRFNELALKDQSKIVDVNFTGVINCIHAAFELLKNTADAHIVNMCSTSALYGSPQLAVYAATKIAIHNLTQALSIEFEKDHITVCDITVPFVDTPMLKQAKKSKSVKSLGIHLTPENIASLVWQAAHGKKLHWTKRTKHLLVLDWLFPFARRAAAKFLLG